MAQSRFVLHPEEFGRALIPKYFRPRLRRYLVKAGYTETPYTLYGMFFYFSVLFTGFFLVTYFLPFVSQYHFTTQMILIFLFWFIVQLAVLLLLMSLIYIYYDLRITQRTKAMDDIIEDFLRYVSENLKGGMSFEKALWEAIRPKFGILAEEIRLIAKRVMTGQDIEDALLEFTEKYDSPILKRSFQLIIEGLKGGGRISEIIDKTEQNIRDTKELKREMVSTNTTYVIFLNFIVMGIAPVLFALSYSLVTIMRTLASKMQVTGLSGSQFSFDLSGLTSNPALQSSFSTFSIGALVVVSLSSAAIVSIIRHGNVKEGLKYVPAYTLISILIYFLFRSIFVGIFSSIV